jgi:TolB-like protein
MTIATAVLLTALVASPKPPTVAVSYFDNNTGQAELAPLAKGLADMLITDLAAVPGIQVVEREKLNEALAELKLSNSRFIDPATAQKLGRGLAARHLLTGGYTMAGPTLRIDVRVFNVETGAVVASESVTGTKDEFFELEARLVAFLAGALQVKLAGKAPSQASGTRSFDAWSQYSAGLDAQDRGDAERARALFEQALRTDPAYRSARNASERLSAIFAQRARQGTAAADHALEGLDPRAPDLAAKVDRVLAGLDDARNDHVVRKIALLTWLGEHQVLACTKRESPATGNPSVLVSWIPSGGVVSVCPQAAAVLFFGVMQARDPSQWETLPKVCEYFVRQLPDDLSLLQYCERVIMREVERARSEGVKSAAKAWDKWQKEKRKKLAKLPLQDGKPAVDNYPAIKAMLAIYARASEGAAAATPPR